MSNVKTIRKTSYILIVVIALLLEGIVPISCSCGAEHPNDPIEAELIARDEARDQEINKEAKEREEREKKFLLLLERAHLRGDGAPEEYIDRVAPLPGSTLKSGINPADLTTKNSEVSEDSDGGGGGSGGDSGY